MKKAVLRNIIMTVVIAALLIIVIVAQFQQEEEELAPERQFIVKDGNVFIPETSPIRDRLIIERASKDTITRTVSAPAVLELNPKNIANVFPPSGGRIVRIFAELGQEVRKGQALFEIYSPDVIEAQSEFISAKNALELERAELERKTDLFERGIIPKRELEEANTNYNIAKSEYDGAKLKLRVMDLSKEEIGEPLIINSPMNGRVLDLNIAQGIFISEPEEPLMLIADVETLWLTASVQETRLGFVELDNKVSILLNAYPDTTYLGSVSFISDILDAETRTVKVRAKLKNHDSKLKPGMFGNALFHSKPSVAYTVPSVAVLQRRDYNYVYVMKDEFLFEKRIIEPGEMLDNNHIEVISGLSEDDYVIVKNAILLP